MRKLLPLLLILLLAFGLRVYRLTAVPPGLTHDEANHGREAIGVLDGDLRFYFPLNYGSEPTYSYTVAGSMALLGKNLFALRFVNALFGTAVIAVTYAWARRAFDRRTALLAAALLAVSFWPLASSREALRAGMLPFFTAAAVLFFWQFADFGELSSVAAGRLPRPALAGFVLCLAATMYIYLAARVAWLMFPLFLGYLALVAPQRFRQAWRPLLLGLAGTGLLVIPMFVYLRQNPWAQTRLSMLDSPLQQITSGQLLPVLENAGRALLAFVWPGFGDQFLAYNIPGRPAFDGLTALFFVIGLAVSLGAVIRNPYSVFRNRITGHGPRATGHGPRATGHGPRATDHGSRATDYALPRAFLLLWFLCGILPSLITGPTANTTRNMAALPAVHLLPAVGFVVAFDWAAARWRIRSTVLPAAAVLWLLLAGAVTVRDYFVRWARDAEVRGAYQVTQVAMFDYLAARQTVVPTTISTVYPGPAHDPSLALVLQPRLQLRWTDARFALIWPGGERAPAVIPASTPPHAAFAPWLRPLDSVTMAAGELDPHFTYYEIAAPPAEWLEVPLANFNDGIWLMHAEWLAAEVKPGETAVMLTAWQVVDPGRVGPVVKPIETTDVVLFTQVLQEGAVVAQRDALDAPSWGWQAGDVFVQLHPVTIPVETAPGSFETILGIYDRQSLTRLPIVATAGAAQADYAPAPPLRVIKP